MPASPYLNPYDINYGGKVVRMATNGHYMFSKSDYGNFRRRVETFEKLYNCKIAIDDYNFGSFNNDILRSEVPYDIVCLHGSMYLDGAKATNSSLKKQNKQKNAAERNLPLGGIF